MLSNFKVKKIRSKKITQSAKGEFCTLRVPGVCNNDPDTTVFAHLPGNKGTSTKNHDLFGVYACNRCHDWLDGRNAATIVAGYSSNSLSGEINKMKAVQETQLKLVEKGILEVN